MNAPSVPSAPSADKQRFPLRTDKAVAEKIVASLKPFCLRITIAGSVCRQKPEVGDIEILYNIPRKQELEIPDPDNFFGGATKIRLNLADAQLIGLIKGGSLEKRLNKLGRPAWGADNKFARAVKTGIPVVFFSATEANWFNYLVCRTGPAQLNTEIATRAKQRGYIWHPTGHGFERRFQGEPGRVRFVNICSEREVFEFVGLKYQEPEDRHWPL